MRNLILLLILCHAVQINRSFYLPMLCIFHSTNIETNTQTDSIKGADNHLPNRWTLFILHITQELYVVCAHTYNNTEETLVYSCFKKYLF